MRMRMRIGVKKENTKGREESKECERALTCRGKGAGKDRDKDNK